MVLSCVPSVPLKGETLGIETGTQRVYHMETTHGVGELESGKIKC